MIVRRWVAAAGVVFGLLALSGCGSDEPTEDGARQACLDEAGGEVTSVSLSGDTATVEGADGNIAWSCIARFEDGSWTADTRAGTGPATQPQDP